MNLFNLVLIDWVRAVAAAAAATASLCVNGSKATRNHCRRNYTILAPHNNHQRNSFQFNRHNCPIRSFRSFRSVRVSRASEYTTNNNNNNHNIYNEIECDAEHVSFAFSWDCACDQIHSILYEHKSVSFAVCLDQYFRELWCRASRNFQLCCCCCRRRLRRRHHCCGCRLFIFLFLLFLCIHMLHSVGNLFRGTHTRTHTQVMNDMHAVMC